MKNSKRVYYNNDNNNNNNNKKQTYQKNRVDKQHWKELKELEEGPKVKIRFDSLQKYQIRKPQALMVYMDIFSDKEAISHAKNLGEN